jgi:hypothetical protein
MYPLRFCKTAVFKSPSGRSSPKVFLIPDTSLLRALAVTCNSLGKETNVF